MTVQFARLRPAPASARDSARRRPRRPCRDCRASRSARLAPCPLGRDTKLHVVGAIEALRIELALGIDARARARCRHSAGPARPRRSAALGRPGKRVEVQRDADRHALAEIAHRRDEDRRAWSAPNRPGSPAGACARARGHRARSPAPAGLIGLDHGLAAAAVAADRVDGERVVGRHEPGCDQRMQQRDRAGGVAARIGHGRWRAGSRPPGPGRARESRRPSPARPDAPSRHRGSSGPSAPRSAASRTVSRAASSGRHRITRSTCAQQGRLGGRVLARARAAMLRS